MCNKTPLLAIGFCLDVDPANAAASQANREEVDSRSVFVGNVSILLLLWDWMAEEDNGGNFIVKEAV